MRLLCGSIALGLVATTTGCAPPHLIASGVAGAVVADSTGIYWNNAGTIVAVEGSSTHALARGLGQVGGLALDGDAIYAQTYNLGSDELMHIQLVRVSRANGASTVLSAFVAQEGFASPVAVGSSAVYWLSNEGLAVAPSLSAPAHLLRTALDGSGDTTLVEATSPPLGIDGLAVDGSFVYFTERSADDETAGKSTGIVAKAPVDGGAVTTLASGEIYPGALAVDTGSVYFSNPLSSGGTIRRAPLSGGSTTTLATNQYGPLALTLGASSLFWVNADINDLGDKPGESHSSVQQLVLDGAAPVELSSAHAPENLAVAGSRVVWSDWDGLKAIDVGTR